MKKFIVIVIAVLSFGQQSKAQKDEIQTGTVRYDGFEHITKGAYWSERPEAKMVYEGSEPLGVTVYTLPSDYFVRFADNEHNNLDRNYIVFPKGEKIYEKKGNYYAAICGNQVVYMKPVNAVKIVKIETKDSLVLRITYKDSVVNNTKVVNNETLPSMTEGDENQPTKDAQGPTVVKTIIQREVVVEPTVRRSPSLIRIIFSGGGGSQPPIRGWYPAPSGRRYDPGGNGTINPHQGRWDPRGLGG